MRVLGISSQSLSFFVQPLTSYTEGVLVAEKNFRTIHSEIGVKNLYVIKLMQSLTSKKFVKTSFNWNHYYYFLNNEGIEYLRELLNLSDEVVPATLKRKPRPEGFRGRDGEQSGEGKSFEGVCVKS